MARHLTTNQAVMFCECPRKYYLRYIKGVRPHYEPPRVLDMLAARALLALLKNEGRFLSEAGNVAELRECYARCLDMAVATSISQSAPYIMAIDPKEAEAHMGKELGTILEWRAQRAERYMRTFGAAGEELAGLVAYPPENVGRRIVDFRHRISGRISLIRSESGISIPVQLSSAIPPRKGLGKGEELTAKMNALLLEEVTARPVAVSSIRYLKISETRSIAIDQSNKEEVKAFVSHVTGKSEFEENAGACASCELRGECGR